jgi:hypothetical protein
MNLKIRKVLKGLFQKDMSTVAQKVIAKWFSMTFFGCQKLSLSNKSLNNLNNLINFGVFH